MAANSEPTAKQVFWEGVIKILPLLVGVAPFGMFIGVISREAGFTAGQNFAGASILYAGASQLVMIDLMSRDVPFWIILLSMSVVNLRMLIFSASLAPYMRDIPLLRRIGLSAMMVDQVYAFSQARFSEEPDMVHKDAFFFGMSLPVVIVWGASAVLGYFVGALIPDSWSITFIVPLMFVAVLVPAVKGPAYLIGALVSALVALLADGLPNNLGMILGTCCGIAVATLVDWRADQSRAVIT